MTRCFGYYLPSCSMIPMADNLNHSHYLITHQLIDIPLHLNPYANKEYSSPSKLINNFSSLFEHLKITSDDQCVINGNFNKNVYD